MAKQLNVNLAFSADTSQIKTQIQDLRMQLNSLMNSPMSSKTFTGLDSEIQKSLTLVAKLDAQLDHCFNKDTGKLDLTKFSASMKKSELTVKDYQTALSNLGPAGDAAFASLARSIANAEVPLRRSISLLSQFSTVMKNTIRWQISSSAIHGLMGGISSAYGYAQDLNESLNNIRIVTGKSTEEMSRFAKEANKAAKSLSTTTTAYTDAALIFYQQGLENDEVKERTDAVIKMSNVTKDSETTVSSYMTAIWNNFAGEKEKLEEYADVITALGAATASSSAEIAGGLEKFAAIGQQIGLSYDYATTALATVVARTRQSEDVVGTAFKTIFARIQGLKLGETLEDGTDLNKYSQALAAVGISIKDASGELKSMDTILDEMGTRWQTLAKDEQIALAQTVAGVRQYNQLVALMDSWQTDFKENLQVAKNAEGELQKQADIYAESWDAARDRVRASAEEIYSSLLNDDFFIKFTNSFSDVLTGIQSVIKGIGGAKGAISLLGFALTKTFGKDIAELVDNLGFKISALTGKTQIEMTMLKNQFSSALISMKGSSTEAGGATAADVYRKQGEAQKVLIENAERLNEETREEIGLLMDVHRQLGDQTIELAKQAELLREEQEIFITQSEGYYGLDSGALKTHTQEIQNQEIAYAKLQKWKTEYARITQTESSNTRQVALDLQKAGKALGLNEKEIQDAVKAYQKGGKAVKDYADNVSKKMSKALIKSTAHQKGLREELKKQNISSKEAKGVVDELVETTRRATKADLELALRKRDLKNATEELLNTIKNAPSAIGTLGQKVSSGLNAISSLGMAFSTLSGLLQTLDDNTASFGDKLLAVCISAPMAIAMVISSMKDLLKAFGLLNAAQMAKNAFLKQEIVANAIATVAELSKANAELKDASATQKSALMNFLEIESLEGLTLAEVKEMVVKKAATGATKAYIGVLIKALPYVAIFAAAVAAIAGVVLYVQATTETASEKMKRLKKDADELDKSQQNAKNRMQELGQAAKAYDEAREKVKGLTKGTQEYATAVEDANKKAEELIKTYGLVEGTDWTNNSGQIELTSSGLLHVQEMQIEANNIYLTQKAAASSAAAVVAQEEAKQDFQSSWDDKYSGTGNGFYYQDITKMPVEGAEAEWAQGLIKDALASGQDLESFYGQVFDEKANTINYREGYLKSDQTDKLLEVIDLMKTDEEAARETWNSYYRSMKVSGMTQAELRGAAGLYQTDWYELNKDTLQAAIDSGDAREYLESNWNYDKKRQQDIRGYKVPYWDESDEHREKFIQNMVEATSLYKDVNDSHNVSGLQVRAISDFLRGNSNTQESFGDYNDIASDIAARLYLSNNPGEIKSGKPIGFSDWNWTKEDTIAQAKEYLRKVQGLSDEEISKLDFSESEADWWGAEAGKAVAKNADGQNVIGELSRYDMQQALADYEAAQKDLVDRMSDGGDLKSFIDNSGLETLIQNSSSKYGEQFTTTLLSSINASLTTGEVENAISWDTLLAGMTPEEANQKLEEISLTPDDWLTSMGLKDDTTGLKDQVVDMLTLTPEEKEAILNSYTEAWNTEQLSLYRQEISKIAEETEFTEGAVEAVSKKIAEENGWLDENGQIMAEQALTTATLAKATFKYQKGLNALYEVMSDNKDVLEEWVAGNNESIEAYEAVGKVQTALETMLGAKPSFDYIKNNFEDLQKLLEGDTSNLDTLREELSDDIIASWDLEGPLQEQISNCKDTLNTAFEGEEIGTVIKVNADTDPALTAMTDAYNQMLEDGTATEEDINNQLAQIGYEPVFEPVESESVQAAAWEADVNANIFGKDVKIATIKSNAETGATATAFAMHGEGAEGSSKPRQITGYKKTPTTPTIATHAPKPTSDVTDSDSKKDPKYNTQEKKNSEDEIERYHVVRNQLEDIEDGLDKISKAKDRAFGPKKLKLIDQEIAKTEELIAKNKVYLSQVQQNLNSERGQLSAFGATFDSNGTITNYEAIMNKMIAEYNVAVEEFNKHTTDDEAAKAVFEAAEKKYEQFKELIGKYEEDQDLLKEIEQEIQDQKDAIFDAKLEKVDYAVEIKLDVDDSDIKYLEFLLTELEDKDFHAAEAIANIGLQTGKSLDKIKQYEKGIEDILKLSGYESGIEGLKSGDISLEELQEGGLTEEGLAKLQEYIDGLAEENEALRAMRENAWAQVSDEFDEYIEKMDNGIEKIEHLKSITQSYQNIVDIVGKKYLGVSNDLVDKMNKSMVSQSQDLLKANKAKLEATQASYDKLMNEDTSGWSDQALKERQQLLDKMKDELQSAKEAFMSSWEEALQASADRYAAAVDNIIEEFSDKVAGLYGSLNELQEAYDRASDLDSQYLEDYEQIYQLSKLTRDINNSIDDTDNIAAKEEYKALLEEINQIEADGTKLSEYDLEVLQKKFELKQAQIALEEAQNAKSSVGMVRGEDGNYSYVYTANDDDVANAEQNYEDKLHEMQVLNGDYINNLQEQIIQTQQECADALAAIKESDFNSYEEWREAVDRTQAYYDQKMDFYYSQLDGALGNNRELYENDWARYSELTGYKISSDENYVDKFEETNYSILTGYTTLEEAHSAWTIATGEMLTDLATAYNEWQIDVETAMGLAGTSVDGFAEQMEQDTDRNVQDSQEAAEAVVDMGQQMEETFSETLSAIANWEAEWGSAIDDAIAKNLELIQSFNDMKREMADAMNAVSSYNPGGDSGSGSGSGGGGSNSGGDSGGSGSGGGANNADKVEGVAAAIWMDGGSTSGWYNGSDRQSRLKEKGVTGAQAYINAHGPNGDIYAAWNKKRNQLKSFYYGSFDTGGYTGDWGDKSGRLALLHSKEIVLNAKDTENFLQAIEMVREISGRIDLNAKYATAMMDMMQPTIGRGGAPEIVQNIEINADFPDATDHSEIEMAFNNLINTASQYANRVR